jgi:predicted ATP-dependent protease
MLETDFTMIKPGSFHRANGGYLILNARDVLTKVLSWEGLKRALRDEQIKIEDIGEHVGYAASTSLRPEPVRLRAKVILLGDPQLFQLLYHLDEDFRELFKVKAHFDSETSRTTERILAYASFVRARCEQRALLPFDRTGLSRLIEFAGERADDQEKLSTQMSDIDDLLGEANYIARRDGRLVVSREQVAEAVALRRRRSSLHEEKLREMIEQDVLLISTGGAAVGQINGLSVYDFGDYAFGRPVRITAAVSVGGRGVVDIERKSQLGGRLHTKGIMILTGFLRERYAQETPLALSASLCFEQSYEGVEGDSASSAELFALLSSLSGLPLTQSLAVTGSVNQKGDIQPIGGVNQKIEGYFDTCRQIGLTGEQGVIIPRRNVRHLMLREDVVEAVRAKRFHIYAIATVDEGIELLTGVPAGVRRPGGDYAPGSVNGRIERRLREMAPRGRTARGVAKSNSKPIAPRRTRKRVARGRRTR